MYFIYFRNGHELCLHLTDTVTDSQKTCILSGFWFVSDHNNI